VTQEIVGSQGKKKIKKGKTGKKNQVLYEQDLQEGCDTLYLLSRVDTKDG